jgi:hypothetical protein
MRSATPVLGVLLVFGVAHLLPATILNGIGFRHEFDSLFEALFSDSVLTHFTSFNSFLSFLFNRVKLPGESPVLARVGSTPLDRIPLPG